MLKSLSNYSVNWRVRPCASNSPSAPLRNGFLFLSIYGSGNIDERASSSFGCCFYAGL